MTSSSKLIKYWQDNGNVPLTNKMARNFGLSSDIIMDVTDLRAMGLVVLSNQVWEDQHYVKSYKLGCQCEVPGVTGCLIHEAKIY